MNAPGPPGNSGASRRGAYDFGARHGALGAVERLADVVLMGEAAAHADRRDFPLVSDYQEPLVRAYTSQRLISRVVGLAVLAETPGEAATSAAMAITSAWAQEFAAVAAAFVYPLARSLADACGVTIAETLAGIVEAAKAAQP